MNKTILRGNQLKLVCVFISGLFILLSLNHLSANVTGGATSNNAPNFLPPNNHVTEINRTAEIEKILLSLNENLMAKHIQKMQDYETRNSYRTDKCFGASEYIYSIFERNGLNASYDSFVYAGWHMRNVIGEKRGTMEPSTIFIVCAHHDSTISGPGAIGTAPGADDNGSGVAGVLAAAEVLSDYEFNYTVRFITFSGEEQGLEGSEHYAALCKAAGENVSGVINLDMIGYNPGTTNLYVNLVTNTASENLANLIDATAQKYQYITKLDAIKTINAATNSDHASFWPHGYDAVMLAEYTFNGANYHSTRDTIDKLNMTYCTNVSQVAIAAIAEFSQLNSTDNSAPSHTPGIPTPNGYGNSTPEISIEITDPTAINSSSMVLCVDGELKSHNTSNISLGFNVSFWQSTPYINGQVLNISLSANDTIGNGFNYSWEFTIDTIPPVPPQNVSISLTRVEAVKRGLAVDHGASGEPDYYFAEGPSVLYYNGEFKMWYTGYYTKYQILYANSTDGRNWVKRGIAITTGTPGELDDTYTAYAWAIRDDTEYKLWYSGFDGSQYRIFLANSSDGIVWTKQGVVLSNGTDETYDTMHTYAPCVIKTDEYKMWYVGEDGYDWRILYANSSDGINWNKYGKPVLSRDPNMPYEKAYVWYPKVIWNLTGFHMWYTGSNDANHWVMYATSQDGITWHKNGLAINKGQTPGNDYMGATCCAPLLVNDELKIWYTGYSTDGYRRILYSNLTQFDNKTDLKVTWTQSNVTDTYIYEILKKEDFLKPNPWQVCAYVNSSSIVENWIGDENKTSYYYKIRAIDRVGNIGESQTIVGKIGTQVTIGWNIVSNVFLEGDQNIANALSTVIWHAARTYNSYDSSNPWPSSVVGRPTTLNDLNTINQTVGLWLYAQTEEIYAIAGQVSNISIYLKAGWNLVAYPYHAVKNVSEALMGVPWDYVEKFNSTAEYDLTEMNSSDLMYPGRGYWVHLTSDATWVATNL